MTRNPLRKAAILIASLDARSADALLDEMPAEEAARVRSAVMELDHIDPREQQQIMRDFMERRPQIVASSEPAVELDPSLLKKLQSTAPPGAASVPHANGAHGETPFGFLDDIDAADLAQVLMREHPQTASLVISHLPPARAADVLRRLPHALQSEALIRIARLKTLAPDVVRDIEHEMQALLQTRRQLEPVVPHGLAAITAILQASSATERHALVAELACQDESLAQHFGDAFLPTAEPGRAAAATSEMPPTDPAPWPLTESGRAVARHIQPAHSRTVTFADLEELEDAALAQVLHFSSPQTALLALAGASHEFVVRILRQLPAREAGQFERKMQQLGPIRLDDIERAQLRLAEVAQRLLEEGRIAMPPVERFAVAA